jgi:hypothetical protein
MQHNAWHPYPGTSKTTALQRLCHEAFQLVGVLYGSTYVPLRGHEYKCLLNTDTRHACLKNLNSPNSSN